MYVIDKKIIINIPNIIDEINQFMMLLLNHTIVVIDINVILHILKIKL